MNIISLWDFIDVHGIPIFTTRPQTCPSCGQPTTGPTFAGGGEIILDRRRVFKVEHACGGEWLEVHRRTLEPKDGAK